MAVVKMKPVVKMIGVSNRHYCNQKQGKQYKNGIFKRVMVVAVKTANPVNRLCKFMYY
jgi:hypothetical protein